jgi:hypothetical protein
LFFSRLCSFAAAVYCAAADKRLQVRADVSQQSQGKFGLAPEWALIIRVGVGSLTRRVALFASLGLLSLRGTIAPGDWESDERDIWNKI